MYPSAVIFDFDGVIVDTEPLHYQAFQKILQPLGLGYGWDDYVQTYMGFDDRDAFREVHQRAARPLTTARLEELVRQKADVFQEVIRTGVTPYPGVTTLIAKLYTDRTPLAICSGALLSDIKPILEQLGIAHCFAQIVSADDVSHSKPDPTSYHIAAERLSALFPAILSSGGQIIAIEDTPAGISSAQGAGLNVIAVSNSYPPDKLQQANRVITSLEELQTDSSWL